MQVFDENFSHLRYSSVPEKTNQFVVGDVHGCYKELRLLEKKVADDCCARGTNPLFVFVGDLIDRGPESRLVVQHLMAGHKAGTHLCVAGNHEAIFLELLEFFGRGLVREVIFGCKYIVPLAEQYGLASQNKFNSVSDFALCRLNGWVAQGGINTLESFGMSLDPSDWDLDGILPEVTFLASLPLVYLSRNLCVTHALAGPLDLEWALTRQSSLNFSLPESGDNQLEKENSLQRILWNRDEELQWPVSLPVHVSGHTPFDEALWIQNGRRLLIDTGCVYGRALTAWSPETGDFVVSSGLPLNV